MHQIKCVLERYPSLMYYSFIKLGFYGILIHNTFFPSISYCHLYAYLNVCFDAINQCSNSIPRIFIYIEIDICTIWVPIQHILNNDWCFINTKFIARWKFRWSYFLTNNSNSLDKILSFYQICSIYYHQTI